MLKRRLIPKLRMTVAEYGGIHRLILVTTRQFGEVIPVGDPVSQARIYQSQAADELIFIDIRPNPDHRNAYLRLLEACTAEIFMPITIGGGIRSLEDFKLFLAHGADKISINTIALENPDIIREASEKFGSQCVVVSIDYRRDESGNPRVVSPRTRSFTDMHPAEWAQKVQQLGAGEILLTSIDHDGMQKGLDLDLAASLRDSIEIPVILSGGCGLASHFSDGFLTGGASAVAAGTFFCFRDQNPFQTRSHIKNAGIPIRLHF